LTLDNNQSLLLRAYRQTSPPLMFLADRINLQAIHDSTTLCFDGTFAYCPFEFYRQHYQTATGEIKTMHGQVYTMNVVYSEMPNYHSSFLSGNFTLFFNLYASF